MLIKEKNLVSFTEKVQSRLLFIAILGWMGYGRRKISFEIFSPLTVYVTSPFSLSQWERCGLLNQYEQYFSRVCSTRELVHCFYCSQHIRSCHKNFHYWRDVFSLNSRANMFIENDSWKMHLFFNATQSLSLSFPLSPSLCLFPFSLSLWLEI